MGLSGRKTKQRIGDDPRNLTWADDAARFGSSYLSKFGWDASKGLGAEGDGRMSHVKVSQKLDMLGIGADHKRDPNGIAWKQNKDFENLLKRLNDAQVGQVDEKMKEADESSDESSSDESSSDESVEVGKKRKGRDGEEDGKTKKKKKQLAEEELTTTTTTTTEVVRKTVTKISVVPRHRAHRARAIAAKNMASKSSSHISEILGIAPTASSSSSSSPYNTPQGTLTPISDELEIDKITTSTKSVADYFKEKLQARSKLAASPSSDSAAEDEDYEAPRMGLGASRLRFEASASSTAEHTETRGLSAFASLKSASLLASFSLASSTTQISFSNEEARPSVDAGSSAKITEVSDAEEVSSRKEKKDKKKDRKDKKGKNKRADEPEEAAQEQEDEPVLPSTSKKDKKRKDKDDKKMTKEERREKRKDKDHKTDETSKKKKRKHSEDSD